MLLDVGDQLLPQQQRLLSRRHRSHTRLQLRISCR
jgi:hypothetical protein